LEARLTIQQLMDEMLHGYNRRGLEYRKLADRKKHRYDAERLENFPSVEAIKAAVLSAMVALASIAKNAEGKSGLEQHLIILAATLIVGIIYYNGFAGRSGEWEAMLKSHVLEQAASDKDFLLCDQRKTADTYGTLAKYVAPGTMQGMLVYIGLPGKKHQSVLGAKPRVCQSVSELVLEKICCPLPPRA